MVSKFSEDCCALLVPDAREVLLIHELTEPSSSVMLPVLLNADDLRFGFGRIILLLGVVLDDEGIFLFKPGLKRLSETFLGRGEVRCSLLGCGGRIGGGVDGWSPSSPAAAATAAVRMAALFCACSSDDTAMAFWTMFTPLLAMARFNVDFMVLLAALAALHVLVVAAAMLAAEVETAFRTALRASSIIIWSRCGASTVSSTLARRGSCCWSCAG